MLRILSGLDPTQENDGRVKESLFVRTVAAPWFGPILIVLGWGPLFLAASVIDILQVRGIVGPHFAVGYAMGWGTVIAVPLTMLGMCSVLFHFVRALRIRRRDE
jgi:hypothetical protein